MLGFWGNITANKAWELVFFHWYRSFKDGITFVNIDINYDRFEGDHNPRAEFALRVLNLTIIEFNIYDTRHTEDRDEENL